MGVAFLVVSVAGLLNTLNALRPSRFGPAVVLSFFTSWLTADLPLHAFAFQATGTLVFGILGAFESTAGLVGLGLTFLSWFGLVVIANAHHHAGRAVDAALDEALGHSRHRVPVADPDRPDPSRRRRLLQPGYHRHEAVRVVRNIAFAEADGTTLHLDVHKPRTPGRNRPVLLVVHGGGWMIGFKQRQFQPLMSYLAARGWVCVNADYRLSPKATFPAHLVDVKRALAWIRAHVAEHGGDPGFVAIAGGSAGGHLCALAALTADDPGYQPGFEHVDTSVAAAVPFYGVYDWTNRLGSWDKHTVDLFFGRVLLKARLADAPERFREASPIDRIHSGAPPFLILHGERDNLAPVEDARLFVERLRAESEEPVAYAELIGSQHAFDVMHTARSLDVMPAVERFLAWVHARYRSEHPDVEAPEVPDPQGEQAAS